MHKIYMPLGARDQEGILAFWQGPLQLKLLQPSRFAEGVRRSASALVPNLFC